mmetsp:Transcript_28720/g.73039  ORF Transcript_28720/g.73039 Transcript_28720/m.73039 type:complete len:200 (-) Transcript_28720:533-1132(-)
MAVVVVMGAVGVVVATQRSSGSARLPATGLVAVVPRQRPAVRLGDLVVLLAQRVVVRHAVVAVAVPVVRVALERHALHKEHEQVAKHHQQQVQRVLGGQVQRGQVDLLLRLRAVGDEVHQARGQEDAARERVEAAHPPAVPLHLLDQRGQQHARHTLHEQQRRSRRLGHPGHPALLGGPQLQQETVGMAAPAVGCDALL